MGMSNYPGGFADGVMIRGIPLTMAHPGKVFWVSNASAAQLPGHKTGSDGNQGTFNDPFATIDYAIGRCTASRGDIIFVKPGHSENITAAAGIVSDIAGVAIVGLGTGSLRPRVRFTTAATADWNITAANCSFVNLEFNANFVDVTAALDISGVAGITFESCYFTDTSAVLNFVIVIDTATGLSDFTINNCKFLGLSAENDSFLNMVDTTSMTLTNNYLAMSIAQTAVVCMIFSSGNLTGTLIADNYFVSFVDGANFIDSDGTVNSGVIARNYFSSADLAGAVTAGFDFSGGHIFESYVAGEADSYGIIGGGTAYNNA